MASKTQVNTDSAQTLTNKTLTAPILDGGPVTLTSGQIAYPSTQVPSAGLFTMDDYREQQSWTPAITFATPGDLNVVYSTRSGHYLKIGRLTICLFTIVTSTFTWTTSSGVAKLTGLPFSVEAWGTPVGGCSALEVQGVTKAGYTQFTIDPNPGNAYCNFGASGSGQTLVALATGDLPSGGSFILSGTIVYFAST